MFFYHPPATTEIYTLSLHDALPISCFQRVTSQAAYLEGGMRHSASAECGVRSDAYHLPGRPNEDRKSTRLNSSHGYISYAVFCLKKKNNTDSNSVAESRQLCTERTR